MPAQGLEKWLEAAEDQTAQRAAVDFYFAHPRGALDALGGRGPDEIDLDSLDG